MKAAIVLLVSALSVVWASGASARCPLELKERTPSEVVDDLRADLAAQDWQAVGCNYRRNAFLIDDQGVAVGRNDIVASLQAWTDASCGAPTTVTQRDVFQDTVRVLYWIDGGWFVVPDGVATYRIRNGKISRQTTHGLIEFTGPPPQDPCGS